MKKTKYIMMVSSNFVGNEVYRRVWEDKDGNYFVKFNGEVRNVNHAKNDFIKE